MIAVRKQFFYCESHEPLEQVVQRVRGCPTPGSVQGFEQTGLAKGVPAHGRSLPTLTVL